MALITAYCLKRYLQYLLSYGPEDYRKHRELQTCIINHVQAICSAFPEMRRILRDLVSVDGQLMPPANYKLQDVWPAPRFVKLTILWRMGGVNNILGLAPPPLIAASLQPPPAKGGK